MFDPALAGRDAADDVRAVFHRLQRMEPAFTARDALNDQSRVFIDEYTHFDPFAAATTFSAASFIPSATMKLSPELRRIS